MILDYTYYTILYISILYIYSINPTYPNYHGLTLFHIIFILSTVFSNRWSHTKKSRDHRCFSRKKMDSRWWPALFTPSWSAPHGAVDGWPVREAPELATWTSQAVAPRTTCWLLRAALAEPQSPRVGPMFFCWRKCCFSFKWTWKLRGFMSKLEMFRQIQQVLDSLNFYHDSFGWAFLVLGRHPHILQGGPPSDVNVGL